MTITPNDEVNRDLRIAFLKLRPTVTNQGANLIIKHKGTTFSIPRSLGRSSKGFYK